MAKAYSTVSHEALCTLTGMTPLEIKIEEAAQLYYATRRNTNDKTHFERDTGVRKWQHPADAIIRVLKEEEVKNPIQLYVCMDVCMYVRMYLYVCMHDIYLYMYRASVCVRERERANG